MTFTQSQLSYAQSVGNASTNGPHFDTRDPTPNDINYPIGKSWINTLGQTLYYLNNFVSLAGNVTANWITLSAAPTTLEFLQGNTGGLVAPDATFKIQLLGNTPLTVTGTPATSTLTISDTSTLIGTITTLGLATGNVLSIPTLANTTTSIQCIIAGYATPIGVGINAGIGGFLSTTVITGSISLSTIGTPDIINNSFVSSTATFNVSSSGLNVLIQVVGDVAYNIDWKCLARIISVS